MVTVVMAGAESSSDFSSSIRGTAGTSDDKSFRIFLQSGTITEKRALPTACPRYGKAGSAYSIYYETSHTYKKVFWTGSLSSSENLLRCLQTPESPHSQQQSISATDVTMT